MVESHRNDAIFIMTECKNGYVPKLTAPPNWLISGKQLYAGSAVPRMAALLAAAELSKDINRPEYAEENAARIAQWEQLFNRVAQATAGPGTGILDLGLVPDLCRAGRPPAPVLPGDVTPEFVASGGLSNALIELIKQQYFDLYCECAPPRPEDTCPCQLYRITYSVRSIRPANDAGDPNPSIVLPGAIGPFQLRTDLGGGGLAYGNTYGIDCPGFDQENLPFHVVVNAASNERDLWFVGMQGLRVENPDDYTPCGKPQIPEEIPPYVPGWPKFPTPVVPKPYEPGSPWPLPPPKIPRIGDPEVPPELFCEPCEEPDMYYWEKEPLAAGWEEVYSGYPPSEGLDVILPSDVVSFMVSFDPSEAKSDTNLRNFKRSLSPANVLNTFINAARIYPLAGGKVIDSIEVSCPETVYTYGLEYRRDPKAVRILPKGVITTVKVLSNPCRWVQKKFDKL